MKPNEPKRQEVEKQDYWQHEKHVKLWSDPLQGSKEKLWQLFVLSRGDLNFCIRGSPKDPGSEVALRRARGNTGALKQVESSAQGDCTRRSDCSALRNVQKCVGHTAYWESVVHDGTIKYSYF